MQFISVTVLQKHELNRRRRVKQKTEQEETGETEKNIINIFVMFTFIFNHALACITTPYNFHLSSYLPCWAHRMKSFIAQ